MLMSFSMYAVPHRCFICHIS